MAIAGSQELFKKISSQVETQFPGFVREEGPQFVAFLKAYFEYMEQPGSPVYEARSLIDNQDIDRTVDSFVEYFRKEFMVNIPGSVLADKRLLAKHIREFYRARGSQESYKFLFRALFNKELEFYYPGDDILRASDGRWTKEVRLRVGDPVSENPRLFEGRRIRGVVSGATAYVQDILCKDASGLTVYDMSLEQIVGNFFDGERVVDIDNTDNFVTVNAQTGSLIEVGVIDGGAYHTQGEQVSIDGAGSTQAAIGRITEVSNKSAVTAKVAKGGNGYTKENTRLIISGGNGTGFEATIASFSSEPISGLNINTDLIGSVKNVRLNSQFFARPVSGGVANTATVYRKLSGTVKLSSVSNTVIGVGTSFVNQLAVGNLVRVFGSANTMRVHSIVNATAFISAFTPTVTIAGSGANAYIGMAGANISTRLVSALNYSSTDIFSINAIAISNPGYGYTTLPTIRIVDDSISKLNLADTHGNVLGNNCVITTNNAPGAIVKIAIVSPGADFNKTGRATIINTTQGNTLITDSYTGSRVSGAANTKYTIRKKTFNSYSSVKPSGFVSFPGRYLDTKGFLSWNNRLQDNYYYQEFSYVLRLTETVEKYKDIVKALLHPAGTKMFGDYIINSRVQINSTQIDSAAVVARRSITERIVAASTQSATAVFTNGMGVTESITAIATHAATFLANTRITEAATATAAHTATYTANTFATESVTSTAAQNATYIANTRITEAATSTATHSATYTANTRITEAATATATHTATFIANTFATEAATATAAHTATFIANTFATESITSIATHAATFIANTRITEAATATESAIGVYTANTFASESVTSTAAHTAIYTANTRITETITAAATHQGQRFALMSGVYAKVLYANSSISSLASSSITPYAAITVGTFDGTPRLVIGTKGTLRFANGAMRANTGSISVGGIGSNLYLVPVGGSNTTIFNVNTIFSNTAFSIRTNYIPTQANVAILYSTGP